MVLTHSMVTTNNVQEDEPQPIALERQVLTLTMAVKCLTRQNQTLEEQLRQKNAAMGNQEEDQEGASADRRNQERSEGSNAPSRPERQNISLPTLMDTAPPIVVEMQAMKEQMEVMMNTLMGSSI